MPAQHLGAKAMLQNRVQGDECGDHQRDDQHLFERRRNVDKRSGD
jgi:hypothetical protein